MVNKAERSKEIKSAVTLILNNKNIKVSAWESEILEKAREELFIKEMLSPNRIRKAFSE
ncbi:hypothetical protein [Brochothrix thermosphacta]|uniref:hypothetical protein n=1 Tax=Brochothrix thermosphacta TaxID=2756 RepID=UPI000D292FAD|nr:hypothetical protein [Brochothrix thermosphacta]SOC32665.1 protein of unknown function [Brochothrix thermosphacta]